MARGVMVPVELDEAGEVLDGHHRVRACAELGITEYPRIIRPGLTEDQKREHILALNLDRRHLTQEQRRTLIAELLKAKPEDSNREVAAQVKVSPTTVGDVRAELEATVQIGQLDRTIGHDGKSRPAHRPAIITTTEAQTQQALTLIPTMPVQHGAGFATVGNLRAAERQQNLAAAREASDEQARGEQLTALAGLADAEDWLCSIADMVDGYGPADLLLTDPPYSTDVEDIGEFASNWLPLALTCVKPTGRAYVFVGAYPEELLAYLAIGLSNENLRLQQILPWTYRNTLGPSPAHLYKQNWQACLYFTGPDAPPLDCPLMTEQFSVQDVNAPDGRLGDRYHAWQKPDDLAERLVRHSTRRGDVVIDPFCGTGTFLLAAARLGRRGWGCDCSTDMLAIAFERGCQDRDITRE